VGFPVADLATPRSGSIAVTLPGGPAVAALAVGPYDLLGAAHAEVLGWLAEHDLTPAGFLWEEYLVGPGDSEDPAAWQTKLVYPLS